jgi:outer membrane protein TolC
MKHFILILATLVCCCSETFSQVSPKPADNDKKKNVIPPASLTARYNQDIISANQDSLIKLKLVKLALNNPSMKIADANIKISESELARAKNAWLGSINIAGNINEFVIQNSPAAVYYPKYNLGLLVPLDLFSKTKSEKVVARENIIIGTELKKDKAEMIKALVLTAYENYKEKKEIVFLERSFIEYDYSAYDAAQKAFSDGDVTVDVMNRAHQEYLLEKSKLVTKEKDLNIAIIQLEQLVGVPVSEALKIP